MIRTGLLIALAVVFFVKTASADTMILVQGYLGNAGSWRGNGLTAVLQRHGWSDGGHISARSGQILQWRAYKLPQMKTKKSVVRVFYTIDLPSEAPITEQSKFLASYLAVVQNQHKGSPLIVAGHSAGGLVARAAIVQFKTLKVSTLITIASPHRGTGAAETGLKVSNSPVGWFAPMVGVGTINRSRGLYAQLVREREGTFLGWLNRQPHPKARYVSIIRAGGDKWVPEWSQDMNGVIALSGKAESYRVSGRHELNIYDGLTLVNLLATPAVK